MQTQPKPNQVDERSAGEGVGRWVIGVTMGDVLGIGPEVVVKMLCGAGVAGVRRWRVYGSEVVLTAAARRTGVAEAWSAARARGSVEVVEDGVGWPAGHEGGGVRPGPTREGGAGSYGNLLRAIEAVKVGGDGGGVDAIVTAPISKESWALAGVKEPGHTEVLARELASPRSAMLFVGPRLRVILATIHVPLVRVAGLLTTAKVRECIELAAECCAMLEPGRARPRVAVAGLNPHAGEGGMFGDEDARVIAPAVEAARVAGLEASGPWPGDTVFARAVGGEFDAVVAMYHDQGLIPVKLVDGREAVNVTAGLMWGGRRVVRTSPAHGTAFDIAWGVRGGMGADATSMVSAARLAVRMLG